jgi:hypothetical protein
VPFYAGNMSTAAPPRAALLASRRLRRVGACGRARASAVVARAPQREVTSGPMASHTARRRAMRDRAVRRPWWPKCLPWSRVLTGGAKASRPGGRLATGDEDPTLEPRVAAAGNAELSHEHLVGVARER